MDGRRRNGRNGGKQPETVEESMNRKLIPVAIAAAFASLTALAARAEVPAYRIESSPRIVARVPDWNLAAAEGMCRLRVWVDDRARIRLRGDRIDVETDSGQRSYDQGSVCTQPLPTHPVDDFHIVVERGRGQVSDVRQPERRNAYAGAATIYDPQDGGASYQIVMAWRDPGAVVGSYAPPVIEPTAPVIADNGTYDEVRACQDRVRARFLDRNASRDSYIEFDSAPVREYIGSETRARIRGGAWAHNRNESRRIDYRCTIDDRNERVLSAEYDVVPRPRLSSIQ
jgi:hypothetical protein